MPAGITVMVTLPYTVKLYASSTENGKEKEPVGSVTRDKVELASATTPAALSVAYWDVVSGRDLENV